MYCFLISLLLIWGSGIPVSGGLFETGNQEKPTPVELMSNAASKGDIRTVRRLLKIGVNPNSYTEEFRPLCSASEAGHLDIVRLLIVHGAKPDGQGTTYSALIKAAWSGHQAVVAYLLDHGANLNRGLRFGSALTCAARSGHWRVAEYLLRKGADPNNNDYHGQRLISFAIRQGRIDWVRRLLKAGARVDFWEKWEWTPLHTAAMIGDVEVVKLLLDHGADLHHAEEQRGDTALSTAVLNRHYACVTYLIQRGARVNPILHISEVDPEYGLDTPLAVARAHGDWRMVDILERAGGKYRD